MDKIVYLALDERPCNADFPSEIFKGKDIQIITPPLDIMPHKRQSGNVEKLQAFLLEETKDAFGLVVSVDTLLYGGLVPSRIHYLDDDTLSRRHDFLSELKKANPKLIIFAFQIIMRCPSNNGGDEEPEYYKESGRAIHLNGVYSHKEKLGLISNEERLSWKNLNLDNNHLQDFEARRTINLDYGLRTIDYVKDSTIDFMIFCQDDAGEYGYPAMDQEVVARSIKEYNLRMKIYAYSGADELGVILLSRMVNVIKGNKPRFFIKYPSVTSPMVIPVLEDRYLDNTIKYQIISAGGVVVPSIEDCDLVLVALIGATKMYSRPMENQRDIDVQTNLVETFEFINWVIERKPVIVADLLFLNAGSINILEFIKENGLLLKLAAYAGWNTSSNALGTAIAQGIQYFYQGNTTTHKEFLIKRYVEDIGYCNIVRHSVTAQLKEFGMDYFNVETINGKAAKLVEKELNEFIGHHLSELKEHFVLENVVLPWARMFEVGFTIRWMKP